jgi:hypothetical protein
MAVCPTSLKVERHPVEVLAGIWAETRTCAGSRCETAMERNTKRRSDGWKRTRVKNCERFRKSLPIEIYQKSRTVTIFSFCWSSAKRILFWVCHHITLYDTPKHTRRKLTSNRIQSNPIQSNPNPKPSNPIYRRLDYWIRYRTKNAQMQQLVHCEVALAWQVLGLLQDRCWTIAC